MRKIIPIVSVFILVALFLASCQEATVNTSKNGQTKLKVVAVESFLADITRNITGDRATVESLIPLEMDPHAFEPTPKDISKIAESRVVVANGAGLESWLDEAIQNAGGDFILIEASEGLVSRKTHEEEGEDAHTHEGDPHFWLDPKLAIHYVENIRDGLIAADPDGKETYTQNAETYISQLKELDAWIQQEVSAIPPERRLIVTNHESFGYFADRYGFRVIGAIIPSVSTGSSPSAQELADLVDLIRQTGTTAIFLETGANPKLAEQIAQETGVKVVSDLYTHSITGPGGNAPSYLEMMKYNVNTMVSALK